MDTLIENAVHQQDLDYEEGNQKATDDKGERITYTTDAELRQYLRHDLAKIKVVGVGGGGNNTINRISEVGIFGTETIGINTDAQDLLYTTADKKILIGKDTCNGLGAGSDPKKGALAAKEQEAEIKRHLKGADMVFITCGLGGGSGTGAAPIVADIAKKNGALTIGIVTLPFTMEGKKRMDNAIVGLEKMEALVDTLIIIPNDKLLELAHDLPLQTAFKVADEILTQGVKGIAEMITRIGLVNLDLADIKAVMNNGGLALIGVGESDSENKAAEAIQKALNNPLLDVDIEGAKGALINVSGGPDMALDDARQIVEQVTGRLHEDATIIWGAQISDDLKNMIKVMIIITGVQSSDFLDLEKFPEAGYLETRQLRKENKERKIMGEQLGIEFI